MTVTFNVFNLMDSGLELIGVIYVYYLGYCWNIVKDNKETKEFIKFSYQTTVQCKLTITDLSVHINKLNTLHCCIRSP